MRTQDGADDPRVARALIVAALADAPTFERAAARRLLHDRVVDHLGPGCELYLAEYDVPHQWFAALIHELAQEPGGLTALCRAVDDLQPGSRLSRQLARLVVAEEAPDDRASMQQHRQLEPVELRELAVIFGTGVGARQLLVAAGLPAERIPVAEGDAAAFWTQVSWLLGHGLIRDGRRRVLAAAARAFPGNRVFATDGS
ncbi:effector-associated domain EAD1-containing protein [Frankia sp. R82]|uniref:effector-associated domain 2-containing protein n=1 Tax=Frankia sp. R82 TaxID=2950553 RepID=UPI0020448421|nr:effector-associated domain EAD1-containing protein [Frankia sp. R82]MCM3882877.1 effector-associated domain EAD1-containing protein [Frankia sp. R82]